MTFDWREQNVLDNHRPETWGESAITGVTVGRLSVLWSVAEGLYRCGMIMPPLFMQHTE